MSLPQRCASVSYAAIVDVSVVEWRAEEKLTAAKDAIPGDSGLEGGQTGLLNEKLDALEKELEEVRVFPPRRVWTA